MIAARERNPCRAKEGPGRRFARRSREAWAGGKSRVAGEVWSRFGNVRTYVEPFYGSGAVLLGRQLELAHLGTAWAPGDTIETACDADPYVTNFWRATARHADQVAVMADWPVHEADLHARHQWLVNQADFRDRMFADPDYFDTKIAAWWVWGLSCWIGSGWCCWDGSTRKQGLKRPDLQRNGQGLGVHRRRTGLTKDGKTQQRRAYASASSGGMGVHKKRPVVGSDNAGRGVHRQTPRANALGGQGVHGHRVASQKPNLGPSGFYKGVHGHRVANQKPALSPGRGTDMGVHKPASRGHLVPWFRALRERLRPVRFVCGDFERVCGKSVVLPDSGHAGLFLDPPYPTEADRHEEIYSVDCGKVAHRAHEVALKWGAHPRVRVAFCGYEGTHEFPEDWKVYAWKSAGGYGGGKNGRGEKNRGRERVWFSPACLRPIEQLRLSEGA